MIGSATFDDNLGRTTPGRSSRPPLPLTVYVVVHSGGTRRVEVFWHDPQPLKGKLLEVRLADRKEECSVGLPLPLLKTFVSSVHQVLQGRRVYRSVLGGRDVTSTVGAEGSGLSLRESRGGVVEREVSLEPDESKALRTTVGHLLLMSERNVAVAGLLPPYHLATPRHPCPICGAETAPLGLERSCLIAEGLAVCRSTAEGAIASIRGNKVPGHVHVLGEPFASMVIVEVVDRCRRC